LAQVQFFHHGWNLTVALTGIHEQPFTLSHYYKICALINVASAAQINYFLHPVVTNQSIFVIHRTLLVEQLYEVGKEDSVLKKHNCSIHQKHSCSIHKSTKSKVNNNFYIT
jgi:hypothetical protein